MTANTPNYGWDYPDDYQQPADSPSAFGVLAVDIDASLKTEADTRIANDNWLANDYITRDANLRADYVARDATKSDIGHGHPYMAQLIPAANGWSVGDGQFSSVSFQITSIGPGEEKQIPLAFNPGTHFAICVQHSSTYIYAVVQDLGNGSGYIKVRNGTTTITHTNVKVHVTFINPPNA